MYSWSPQQKLDHLNLLLSGGVHDSMVKKWASYVDADKFAEPVGNVCELVQNYEKQFKELEASFKKQINDFAERCEHDVKSWRQAHDKRAQDMADIASMVSPGQLGNDVEIAKQGIEKLKQECKDLSAECMKHLQERVFAEEQLRSLQAMQGHQQEWFENLRKLLQAPEGANLLAIVEDRINKAGVQQLIRELRDLLKDEPAVQSGEAPIWQCIGILKKNRDDLREAYQASQREINGKCEVISEQAQKLQQLEFREKQNQKDVKSAIARLRCTLATTDTDDF